jgi:hypothetical protein
MIKIIGTSQVSQDSTNTVVWHVIRPPQGLSPHMAEGSRITW